jgi:hypothetical protein
VTAIGCERGPANRALSLFDCGLFVGFVGSRRLRVEAVDGFASLAVHLDGIHRPSEKQHFWFCVRHGFILLSVGFFLSGHSFFCMAR